MRESIGGAWLFGIVAVFIALFTAFLAYSISYTRAFNTKNEIINIIERKEGYTTSPDLDYNMTLEQLHAMYPIDYERTADVEILMNIKSIGYNYSAARGIDCRSVGHPDGEANEGGKFETLYVYIKAYFQTIFNNYKKNKEEKVKK